MKISKLLLLAVGLTFATDSFAIVFGGNFNMIITETNNPDYAVGMTGTGHYKYISDTADGVFAEPAYALAHGIPDQSLTSALTVWTMSGDGSPTASSKNDPSENDTGALLVVDGGIVTAFDLIGTFGDSVTFGFDLSSFWVTDSANEYFTTGSLTVDDPQDVPDTASTLGLLTAASIGLIALRRRLA